MRAVLIAAMLAGTALGQDAACLLPIVTGGATWTPASLAPVAYWTGDGTAADSSGNGRNGTWNGTTAYAAGVIGQAFSFDAASYVRIDDVPITAYPWSVALWALSDDTGKQRAMFSQGSATNSTIYYVAAKLSTSQSSALTRNLGGQTAVTGADVGTNTWTHFAYLFKADKSVSIYTNGTLCASGANMLTASPVATTSLIGMLRVVSPTGWWLGLVDDVSLYSRELTEIEIAQLYNYR